MLSYLQGNTRPDIYIVVHQTARFCINPQLTHEEAIKKLGCYLLRTIKEGIVLSPDKSKGLECYVDPDFAVGCQQVDADGAEYLMSRTAFVIMYVNCSVL